MKGWYSARELSHLATPHRRRHPPRTAALRRLPAPRPTADHRMRPVRRRPARHRTTRHHRTRPVARTDHQMASQQRLANRTRATLPHPPLTPRDDARPSRSFSAPTAVPLLLNPDLRGPALPAPHRPRRRRRHARVLGAQPAAEPLGTHPGPHPGRRTTGPASPGLSARARAGPLPGGPTPPTARPTTTPPGPRPRVRSLTLGARRAQRVEARVSYRWPAWGRERVSGVTRTICRLPRTKTP